MDKISELENIKKELEEFSNQAQFGRTKNILKNEILKVEAEIAKLKDIESLQKNSNSSSSGTRKIVSEITEFAFDESDKYVKIYIPFENASSKLKDEDIDLNAAENKISLAIRSSDSKTFVFNVNSLLHPVDIAKSYKKIKTDMVAVFLKKEKEGLTWKFLTSTEKHLKSQKEKIFDKDEGGLGGTDGDPGNALMNMMKKMYETGDDQMKRTLQKAWIEGQEKKHMNPML